ncbi:MAG TPA: hypothetical protein VF572_03845 [Candidatus Saccharimonadales bacterium]|jgi:hypothetical protein
MTAKRISIPKLPSAKRGSKPVQTVSRRTAYLLAAGLILLAAAVATQAFYIRNLYRHADETGSWQIKTLIVKSVQDGLRPAVIDPANGKVYIPEAKLVLPAAAQGQDPPLQVQYNYSSTEVAISDRGTVNQASAQVISGQSFQQAFDKVPALQACSRHVTLRFNPQADTSPQFGEKLVLTKPLSDGRTGYFYEAKTCMFGAGKLMEYLKQIDSY